VARGGPKAAQHVTTPTLPGGVRTVLGTNSCARRASLKRIWTSLCIYCRLAQLLLINELALTSAQVWEDNYFQGRTTRDLKIRYQIGHPLGEDCPLGYLNSTRGFVVLHDNGIHVLDIDFCCCAGAPSEVAQLLNVGWFPATHKDPSTAATLGMLQRFHKLNLQARLPAYDYYNTLLLLSNGAGLKNVPVCFFLAGKWDKD
jgi:hypothetical protein